MRKRRMATITIDPSFSLQINKETRQHGAIIEEIDGLIRVCKDGHVERTQIIPCVTPTLAPEFGVTSKDIVIDKFTNVWARFYVPKCNGKLPLLVYFHGGGFCVGSAAWICYHEFLARLSANAQCVIMSVNYRLAPENPLPVAYDDGFKALMWIKQQSQCENIEWWSSHSNFSSVYLVGDSAGANIAYNVAVRLNSIGTCESPPILKPLIFKGTILIQPFFGGVKRTCSENYTAQPPRSALTLATSDTYWRLSLPTGANRDHPWCNPMANDSSQLLRLLPTLVCVSEMDILKDRNLDFCAALGSAGGQKVECVMYKGVGHAFQILNKSQLSQTRTQEMISHIKAFIIR